MPDDRIQIENINTPGRTERVNRAKYEAMREALLAVLLDAPPGLKVPEAKAALLPLLPDTAFPAGDRAGWWLKAVQLDLEAKGIIRRAASKPIAAIPRRAWIRKLQDIHLRFARKRRELADGH